MALILQLRKTLGPITRAMGLRGAASRVYRIVLRLRYGRSGIGTFHQNGRAWKLHYTVAERGEDQEFETTLWFRKHVRPGDVVFDIGANVGQMTLEAALLAGPHGRVVAIEPAPGNLQLLRQHVTANRFDDRTEIIPAACASTHGGELVLHVFGDNPETVGSGHTLAERSLEVHAGLANCECRVPCVSVDGLCAERNWKPSAIKIDVEGAELEVLRGAVQTLMTVRPAVRFGFHPHCFTDPATASREIQDLLKSCGYSHPTGTLELREYDVMPVN